MPDTPDTTEPTARAALIREAAALIGADALARALDVSSRSVHYWMAGDRDVRDGVLDYVHQVLDDRLTRMDALARRIRTELAAQPTRP